MLNFFFDMIRPEIHICDLSLGKATNGWLLIQLEPYSTHLNLQNTNQSIFTGRGFAQKPRDTRTMSVFDQLFHIVFCAFIVLLARVQFFTVFAGSTRYDFIICFQSALRAGALREPTSAPAPGHSIPSEFCLVSFSDTVYCRVSKNFYGITIVLNLCVELLSPRRFTKVAHVFFVCLLKSLLFLAWLQNRERKTANICVTVAPLGTTQFYNAFYNCHYSVFNRIYIFW